ncbi:unnamed protein product [Penicillium glandicola]
MAMPGHHARAEITSLSPSTAATTTPIQAASTTPTSLASAGQDAELYKWTKFLVDMYSSSAVNESNTTVTLLKYLPTVAGIGDCVLDPSDATSCEAHVVTPLVKAVRSTIANFYAREKKIHATFYAKLVKLRSEAEAFVTNFTHYDVSNISVSNYFGLSNIAMTLLNPTSLTSSLYSAWLRVKTILLSYDAGLWSATASDVTAVFTTADNFKVAFHQGAVLVKNAAISGLATSAINVAWVLDDVFIAKASDDVNKEKPADMDLSILGDDARTCDGNGTCYFFIVSQQISNLKDNKWVAAKGLDKLTNYNITLLEFAKSAEWYQDQFGGYLPELNSSQLLQSLQSNGTRPSLSYFVNMPLVDYDNLSAISSNETYTGANSTEEIFLNVLAQGISNLKSWPY